MTGNSATLRVLHSTISLAAAGGEQYDAIKVLLDAHQKAGKFLIRDLCARQVLAAAGPGSC